MTTTIPDPTHVCRYCGEPIYQEPNVSWVCARSGDDGGTYDLCTLNDLSEGHKPWDAHIIEIHNPVSVGWRWVAPNAGVAHEVAWIRGGRSFLFGTRVGDKWHTTSMDRDRWHCDDGTLESARFTAFEFIGGALENDA